MHYLVSTLSCFSTLYLDGNHGLAGLCICLLIEVQTSSNVLSGMMDGYMMWCQIIMPQLLRNLKNTSRELWRSRALTICSGSIWSISPFVLPQLSGPWLQPASAAAYRRVLEPDILEVSHLCGCIYWKRVCACLCLNCEHMIVSWKPKFILERGEQ